MRKTFAKSFNALFEKIKFITNGWKRKEVKEESKANMQFSGVFGNKKLIFHSCAKIATPYLYTDNKYVDAVWELTLAAWPYT